MGLPPNSNLDVFDRLPGHKKAGAYRWQRIIQELESYKKNNPPGPIRPICRDFAKLWAITHPEEKPFSGDGLYKKTIKYRKRGILALIDGRDGSHKFAEWPKEAKAYIWQLYCNPNQPTVTWCIKQLKIEARARGWNLPPDRTIRRYLERIPKSTRDYYRKGESYWRQHYQWSVLRDYEEMDPGEVYVADHVQINVAVRHPSGRTTFPWFTGWMDMRSRKILGWTLADMPSANTINLSLKHTIEKYGAPEHVIIDNGRDFSARHFSGGVSKRFRFKMDEDETAGIYKLLGIEPHFCIPANAQAKNIERWFWTMEQGFEKAFQTYRGNNTLNRPENVDRRIKAGKAVPEWNEIGCCMGNYVEIYNQDHEHQGHGMKGRTPNEVWNAYFETHAQRRVSPSSLRLLMMKSSKPVKVGRFGVRAFEQFYESPKVMDYHGQEVVYRYDPQDLSMIYVYTKEWAFIDIAKRIYRTAWDDEEAYHEIKKLEKKRKRAIQAEREAAEKLIQVEFGYTKQELSGEHEDKSAKIVRIAKTALDNAAIELKQGEFEEDRTEAPRKRRLLLGQDRLSIFKNIVERGDDE